VFRFCTKYYLRYEIKGDKTGGIYGAYG
jgi:hypothetical protein